MTVLLALVICCGPLVWMLWDGRRHQKRIDTFRQRSHVRIIRPEKERTA